MSNLPTHEQWWPRFAAKVAPPDTNGCRRWTAATDPNGYGRFWLWGNMQMAHRVLLVAATDVPADTDLTVDHRCEVRDCVTLDHLRWMDAVANTMRGQAPPAKNARKTHCVHGHVLDGRRRDGHRYCLTCNRERVARHKRRRKAGAS